ncbi:DUF3857 domain-containing protein [Marivirga arenosa]|uniref:DUF3857 domain-containing protein n=1 Tax=Marivirga arenosa TaxID=3059076 RepID=A0AA51X3J2_9BACT|nr:DUF3857 domain-containing protein [Marivirga sp. BKB1-2]WNB16763.1 DUF3857 domain-containing protein [Marivirga sp. BKB1-2]
MNSTVINSKKTFTIHADNKSVINYEYSAIIHNKYASRAKQVMIPYDDFTEVEDAEVLILSLDGSKIDKINLKDFQDYAMGSGSLASDARVKYYEPSLSSYPYIIKISYEVTKTGSLHFPVWQPVFEENMEVKRASFTVVDKSNYDFHYKAFKLNEPEITIEGNTKTYAWEVKDLDAIEFEYFNNYLADYAPLLQTAPNFFQMDGFKGSMHSWKDFGKWISILNAERQSLEGVDLSDLDQRVLKASSQMEKIAIVYDYLQNNNRYVSIQLGIGGWQPFEASFVHEKKYGDCKALSNYTQVLLDRYGISSYYTLIKAGAHPTSINEDFPNAHFNHAIVSVPMESDTIFLECTSQTNPFGYIGKFTSDRNALMITPEGGKLIHTTKYEPEDNLQITKVEVDLSNAITSVDFSRSYTGIEIDNYGFHNLYVKDSKSIEDWMRRNHEWGGAKLENIELKEVQEGKVPKAGYSLIISSDNEYVKMGDRKFLNPSRYLDNFLPHINDLERNTPIKVRYGFSQNDTIVYKLGEYHQLESKFDELEFRNKYGSYTRKLTKNAEEVIYTRQFIFNDGEYPKEEYKEFLEFINKVRRADNEKFVLLSKT